MLYETYSFITRGRYCVYEVFGSTVGVVTGETNLDWEVLRDLYYHRSTRD